MAAHFMTPDVDCGGCGIPGYWRDFAQCSDGTYVIGTGATAEEAESKAVQRVQERETYLQLPDVERLRMLVKGDLLDTDQREAIRLLAKLLIENI
jgi:hypothetical protein